MKYDFLNVCTDVTKYATKIPQNNYLSEGKYPIFDQGKEYIGGYSNDETNLVTDFPYIIFGDHTRVIKYVDSPCYIGADGVKLLKVSNNKFLSKYVYYSMLANPVANQGYSRHFKLLKETSVRHIDIDFQRSIIDELDSIKTAINIKNNKLLILDELIKSRFIEMFGDLENNTHNYPIKSLSEISTYWNGLTYKPTDVVGNNDGILVLRSSNIQEGQLAFEDNVYVNCNIKERQYVKENDILMCSRNGSARLVGKVALIKGLDKPTSFGAFMMIFRSEYYPYLKVYFEMPDFRSQLATGTSTINQITGGMLNAVKLPVPDLDTVMKFKEFVEDIDKLKFIVQKEINDLQELLDKKMQEYFGE